MYKNKVPFSEFVAEDKKKIYLPDLEKKKKLEHLS